MPDIETIIRDLTSQELVLDQWRTALQEAVADSTMAQCSKSLSESENDGANE